MTEPEPPYEYWRAIWDQFRLHRGAMAGLCILGVLILFVLLGPLFHAPPDLTTSQQLAIRNSPPSLQHPFGTDRLGRDLLLRMMLGGRVSISVGLVAMIIAITLGTAVGVLAGYFRRLDGPLMRLTDMFLALPLLPLMLVMMLLFREKLAGLFGPEAGTFLLITSAIGMTSWMQTARILRGEVLAVKERDFIVAAQSIGTPPRRVILRHILPNVISPIMVSAMLGIASAIITESALSFLGFGFPPDFPTWGRLLFDGVDQMRLFPMRAIWPGLAISLTVLSVNYIGDGLRDAFDPRIRLR